MTDAPPGFVFSEGEENGKGKSRSGLIVGLLLLLTIAMSIGWVYYKRRMDVEENEQKGENKEEQSDDMSVDSANLDVPVV